MEEENAAATQAPKSAEVEDSKAEPSAAADTKETTAAPSKEDEAKPSAAADAKETAAAPSKEDEAKPSAAAADTKEKAASPSKEGEAEPAAAADTKETAASPSKEDESMSEAVDDKKSEETSEEPTAEKAKEEESESDESTPAAAEKNAEPAPTGRGMRQRKATQRLQPVEAPQKKERVIPAGKGEKLEDIPNVVANFKGVTWSDPHLKMLYNVVFGMGKKKEFKGHLLQFSGLVYPEGKEEEEQERIKNKMYKWTMPELKEVMDLVDIDRTKESFVLDHNGSPGKEEHCQRLLEWIEEPKASGKNLKGSSKKSPGKRKSTGSAKGSAKKAKKTPEKKPTAKKVSTTKKAAKAKESGAVKVSTAKKATKAKESGVVDLNIPGVDIDKVRTKVKSIVESANREELTVKGVRKMLEDWLDTDLSEHKDAVRSIVMEVM